MTAAVWFPRARTVEIRQEPLRDPRPDEIHVRAIVSALSHGTERLVFEGRVLVPQHVWAGPDELETEREVVREIAAV